MASRGRGAGVNKPAWMVQKEREEAASAGGANGGANGGSGGDAKNDGNGKYADAADERNGGGGDGRSRSREGGSGGEPERDQFGRIVGRGGGGGGDRGGGGGDRGGGDRRDYDDRRGGGRDYDDRGRGGRDYDDRRGGYDRRGGRYDDYDDRRGGYDRRGRRDDYDDRPRRGGGRRDGRRRAPSSGIYFHSYEEERAWLDDRRRKRRSRKSLFDVEPTPEQVAEAEARAVLEMGLGGRTGGGVAATGAHTGLNAGRYGSGGGGGGSSMQPQQTRHARRLYVGNIPDLSEENVHNFFRDAIRDSLVLDPAQNPNASSHRSQYVDSDPIISVYINRERRFAFLEFKTMEITTACLQLDGIDVMGQGKVKVKRPNDYNAALAPMVNPATAPKLDTAKLGIVSPTVPDGPNKIFIGGLPYHLTEAQVLELLGAFGTVRAFHLVKQDANATTSKGYCFVEYSDPNITQVACMGLNGMDMGGGKQLSCRMAAQQFAAQQGALEQGGGAFGAPVAAPPVQASVVDGVDVDALLSAALGGGAAPAVANPAAGMGPMGSMMPGGQQQAGMAGMMPQQVARPQGLVVTDPLAVANAAASALDAAFGNMPAAPVAQVAPMAAPVVAPAPAPMPVQQQQAPPQSTGPTRILVLLNMVMDEDLSTDEDHKMLEEEVREEVSKYGKLLSMKIPRPQDGYKPSAVKKIYLEYASPNDAVSAERELKGRAFGPNVVDAAYFDEDDYARGNLS